MAKTKNDNENNLIMTVKGSTLTMTVDLEEELREAESGKSTIISTAHFEKVPDNEEYLVKLMVIKMKPKEKKKSKKDKD